MHLIGNLGHPAVLIPASFGVLGFLFWSRARRDAFAFAAALMTCLATTGLAKLAFGACPSGIAVGIESPSGHASFSAAFYGCLASLVGTAKPIWQKVGLYGGAALFVLLIGYSRVVDGAHTKIEVNLGLLIGAASILLFCALRRRPGPLFVRVRAIAIGSPFVLAFVVAVLLVARHWTPEPIIEAVAVYLGAYFHLCD